MYVELGLALGRNIPVVVVGEDVPTIFMLHPLVHRVSTISEVGPLLKGDKLKFGVPA